MLPVVFLLWAVLCVSHPVEKYGELFIILTFSTRDSSFQTCAVFQSNFILGFLSGTYVLSTSWPSRVHVNEGKTIFFT